jgi:cytochrome b6-f complex iron-sulfur subunit
MKRRDFIVQGAMAGISCTLLGGLLQGCKTPFYVPHRLSDKGDRIIIRKAEMGENPFVLVRNEKLPAPIYLLKKGDQYSGVLMICTHKGCEVKPAGGYLVCPCHGSEFSAEGKVLSPPADKDLLSYNIATDNEFIYIQL